LCPLRAERLGEGRIAFITQHPKPSALRLAWDGAVKVT